MNDSPQIGGLALGGACPLPLNRPAQVLLAHGGGGRMTADLLAQVFRPALGNELLAAEHDGAVLAAPAARLALTSDGFVVQPLFFPGGDIGSLAVHGTVNDLAMCGARPLYLTANFILEEGLPLATLEAVVRSMSAAARACGVQVVAGDTKVVQRGKGDGLYLGMAGLGAIEHALVIAPRSAQPGDVVLLSGDLGRHGIAVLAAREGLEFAGALPSDCAPLWEPVQALLAAGVQVRCLRDLTRGGLAAALVEIAGTAGLAIEIDERAIPVAGPVRGACELLGFDPLHVACEGRCIAIVPAAEADAALSILQQTPVSAEARQIGTVHGEPAGQVTRITPIGSRRLLDLPSGEQLPRIC